MRPGSPMEPRGPMGPGGPMGPNGPMKMGSGGPMGPRAMMSPGPGGGRMQVPPPPYPAGRGGHPGQSMSPNPNSPATSLPVSSPEPFTCQNCGKQVTSGNDKRAHTSEHISYLAHQCETCDKTFQTKPHRLKHVMSQEVPAKINHLRECFSSSSCKIRNPPRSTNNTKKMADTAKPKAKKAAKPAACPPCPARSAIKGLGDKTDSSRPQKTYCTQGCSRRCPWQE